MQIIIIYFILLYSVKYIYIMVHTYSDSNKIYSVDMMLAYINIFKPKNLILEINIDDYSNTLDYKGWSSKKTNLFYSPMDVITQPKQYKEEYKKITQANLKYPIIIDKKNNIIDGVHRLSKAYLLGKKKIKAYFFNDQLLKKFLIDNKKDFNKVDKLTISDYIVLFNQRFE
jgi:hypothetical protein